MDSHVRDTGRPWEYAWFGSTVCYRIKENRMLILIILLLLLFGGGGYGYRRYGPRGGLGIGGVILVILLVWLLLGGGLGSLRF